MDIYGTSFLTDSLRRRFSTVSFSTLGEQKIITAERYLGSVPLEFTIEFSTKGVKLTLEIENDQLIYDLSSRGKYLTTTKVSWADVLINISTEVEESYTYKPSFFGPDLFSSKPNLKNWLSKEIARTCSFSNAELPLLVADLDEPQPGIVVVSISQGIKVIFPDDSLKYFQCDLTSENALKFLGWYTSASINKDSLHRWFSF